MPETNFRVGDEVYANGTRGTVIDQAATASGKWVYAVERSDGEVRHYTPTALQHA